MFPALSMKARAAAWARAAVGGDRSLGSELMIAKHAGVALRTACQAPMKIWMRIYKYNEMYLKDK